MLTPCGLQAHQHVSLQVDVHTHTNKYMYYMRKYTLRTLN